MAKRFHFLLFAFIAFVISCVDRLPESPNASKSDRLIVDGFISNEPGPYTVKLFRSRGVYTNLESPIPVIAKSVIILVDGTQEELLKATSPGIYQTSAEFRGEFDRTYQLRIADFEGNIFQSTEQRIHEAGTIDSIYYQYVPDVIIKDKPVSGFRVFFDSDAGGQRKAFFRWRYQGTYRVVSNPELRTKPNPENPEKPLPDPPGCAFSFSPEKVLCECCECWITDAEEFPRVANLDFVSNGRFREIELDFIPVTAATFHDKFRIEIKQQSLERDAYEFWRLVSTQITSSDDLFQPPGGHPPGNITHINGDEVVEGLFYAAGVTTGSLYITREEVRKYTQVPRFELKNDCRLLGRAVTDKPDYWED